MKTLIIASALLALVGCAQSSGEYHNSSATDKADITFIGIPTALGIGETGTTFPVTETLSLTAKHVPTPGRTFAEHPDCDVKLIKHDNHGRKLPVFRNPNLGDTVTLYGYSARTAMMQESTGVALQNFTMGKCVVTTMSNGGVQGQSGGPVYNTDGTIAGVFIAVSNGDKRFHTVMVPYAMIENFLKENVK